MSLVANTFNYLDGETVLEGYFAYDDSFAGQRPVVMIHHAWAGRDGFVEEKARQLAAMGYLAFAADCYGKGQLGSSAEENAALMQPLMADRLRLRQRLLAALAAVKLLPWADNHKIAAIGYCFGGLCALDLARSGAKLSGVVSFHGLLQPPQGLASATINAKVLVLHGHDDPMVTPDQVLALQTELTAAGADWQVHSFGHTVHAFTNPKANDPSFGTVYSASADARSTQLLQQFLQELFGEV